MKRFKKFPVFLAQVSVTTGILCSSVFATETVPATFPERGTVPDANNVMKNLGSNESVNSIVKPIMGIFGSVYDAVRALGIELLILSVVFAAIGFSTSGGNGGKREESKTQLFYALAAAAGIGAVVSIATAFLKIGASI